MTPSIRNASTHDLAKIQAIARRTIDACYRSFLGDEGVDWFINSGASDQYLSDNLDDCRVLEVEGGIIGFSVAKGELIDLMMVDCGAHRHGYGSKLLADCERRLFSLHDELRLESYEGNERANTFYGKHGWIVRDKAFDEDADTYKLIFVKTM